MDRENFIKIVQNKSDQSLLYIAYMEFKDENHKAYSIQEFVKYLMLWVNIKRINLQRIIDVVTDYYSLKFEVVRLFDNKNLIKIY